MFLSNATSIWFPGLGLEFENVGKSINVFGLEIAFYAIVIACGMAAGYLMVEWMAKLTKQSSETYLDFALYAIIFALIGARSYYVVFSWDSYKDNLMEIFNIRNGGLAIYGGVIAAVLTAYVYAKIKKINFALLVDTACIGLVTGQIIGRFGNFFNREAFGKHTEGKLAMLINVNDVSYDYAMPRAQLLAKYEGKSRVFDNIMEIRDNIVVIGSEAYLSVHPTFLYESIWNVGLLIFLFVYTKYKKFHGEVFLLYLGGYGLGRFWIEGLRTDQLFLLDSPIAVSQLLSLLLVISSLSIIIFKVKKMNKY